MQLEGEKKQNRFLPNSQGQTLQCLRKAKSEILQISVSMLNFKPNTAYQHERLPLNVSMVVKTW